MPDSNNAAVQLAVALSRLQGEHPAQVYDAEGYTIWINSTAKDILRSADLAALAAIDAVDGRDEEIERLRIRNEALEQRGEVAAMNARKEREKLATLREENERLRLRLCVEHVARQVGNDLRSMALAALAPTPTEQAD